MLLAIDSTTATCSTALIDGERLVDERHELVGRGHAERLMPMIDEMLAGRRPPLGILVDCGPGSFTGVRVGLAAAHGLAIGWGIPLYGYSAMALVATGEPADQFAVALEGGHGQLFVQSYGREPLQSRDPLRSLPPQEAAAAISARLVLGSGAEALVKARGFGEAKAAELRAANARWLPAALRSLPPKPIYGRAPDAKPMP